MKQWFKKYSIPLTLIPVVLMMGLIFAFSAQTGEDSGALSGEITRWVLCTVMPDWENIPAQEQEHLLDTLGLVIRKLAHFSEYAVLGVFLMLHLRQIEKRAKVRSSWLIAWGVGTVYAASDELHQSFVGGRGPAVTDVCIDSSGVIAGVTVLLVLASLRKRRKEKHIR